MIITITARTASRIIAPPTPPTMAPVREGIHRYFNILYLKDYMYMTTPTSVTHKQCMPRINTAMCIGITVATLSSSVVRCYPVLLWRLVFLFMLHM